jgi:hypothetical protein
VEPLHQNVKSDLLLETQQMYYNQTSQHFELLKPIYSHPYKNVTRTGIKSHIKRTDRVPHPQTTIRKKSHSGINKYAIVHQARMYQNENSEIRTQGYKHLEN